jgi:tRNA dimethylallyltransferase
VIVGGTGLHFEVLTKGLADIPETPADVRARADALIARDGVEVLAAALDPVTSSRLDLKNPARVQRAWEVQETTGRGMADWQDDTPPPLLAEGAATCIVLSIPPERLTPRIEERLDLMLGGGAIEEAEANAPDWHRSRPSAKAIGAAELIAHVRGEMTLDEARARIAVLTRQYAKRQRTFFRGRLKGWKEIAV